MSESKVDDKREPLLKKQEETKKEEEHIQVKESKTAKSNNNKKDNKKEWSPTMKRTLKLTIGLLGSYYLAATCKCKHPTDWIYKVFVCRENEANSTPTSYGLNSLWNLCYLFVRQSPLRGRVLLCSTSGFDTSSARRESEDAATRS